jgi:RecG-like helicase
MATGLFHLKRLGVYRVEQRPLVLPLDYEDLRRAVTDFSQLSGREGEFVFVSGRVLDTGRSQLGGKYTAALYDEDGHELGVEASGDDIDALQGPLSYQGRPVYIAGTVAVRKGQTFVVGCHWVPERQRGAIQPLYPRPTRLANAEAIREGVQESLAEDAPRTARWLLQRFQEAGVTTDEVDLLRMAGSDTASLETLLHHIHRPDNPEQGPAAIQVLQRVVAHLAVAEARAARPPAEEAHSFSVDTDTLLAVVREEGLELNRDQQHRLARVHRDLRSRRPARLLLNGPAGTGKTAVYGAALVAVARMGGRAALVTPGRVRAEQVVRSLTDLWPHDTITQHTAPQAEALPPGQVVVTHRDLLDPHAAQADLLVVLEAWALPDKWHQRCRDRSGNLVEVTDCCLPVAATLLDHGGMDALPLPRPIHPKHLTSNILERKRVPELEASVQQRLEAEAQVLVVHPPSGGRGRSRRPPEHGTYQTWEKAFPGRLHRLQDGMKEEEITEVVGPLSAERPGVLFTPADLLGQVKLPELRYLVLFNPEQFGPAERVRLRGHLAPRGGSAQLDLVTDQAKDEGIMRGLRELADTADGCEIVMNDLRRRAEQELDADTEAEAGWAILPGRLPDPDLVTEYAARV